MRQNPDDATLSEENENRQQREGTTAHVDTGHSSSAARGSASSASDPTDTLPALPLASHSSENRGLLEGPTQLMASRTENESTVTIPRITPPPMPPSAREPHRDQRKQRHVRPAYWIVSGLVLLSLLALAGAGAADAYARYSHMRTVAADGIHHLRAIQALMPSSAGLQSLLNRDTLRTAQTELTAAERDFAQLRVDLTNPGGSLAIAAHVPGIGGTISSTSDLVSAADEACQAGLDVVAIGQSLDAVLQGGFFATAPLATGAPQFDALTLQRLQTTYDDAVKHLGAAASYAGAANVSALPASLVSPKEQAQIKALVAGWPTLRSKLQQADDWLAAAPVLFGATAPEHLLLLLMDRSELRATGGFQGNYAVATVQNGKVQPFSLTDTYFLDWPFLGRHGPMNAPAIYPWWPYQGIFGLRDSNISADFPTTAHLAAQLLRQEGGPAVQGVVAFTPVAIEQLMTIVGNIDVPEYGEVATPQNLENLIHKYQLGSNQPEATRKHFTALLAQHLIARLHGLSSSKLFAIIKLELNNLRTKDIQVYLSDKRAESLIAQAGNDGSVTRGPGDGVTIIDENVGGSKANQFVSVQYTDAVTLDAQGTATHHLTINYDFHASDVKLLYGTDFYKSYLRVYTPTSSRLTRVDGFDFSYLGPTLLNASDLPGRHMWGGYVFMNNNTRYTLHFVWSVPHAATRDSSGQWQYHLVFQHQAGSNQHLTVSITPTGQKVPATAYNGVLNADQHYEVSYRS